MFAEFDIEFVRRFNAFFEEYPYVTVDDLKKFWIEFKPLIIEDHYKARKWDRFEELVEGVIEESIEKQIKRME